MVGRALISPSATAAMMLLEVEPDRTEERRGGRAAAVEPEADETDEEGAGILEWVRTLEDLCLPVKEGRVLDRRDSESSALARGT